MVRRNAEDSMWDSHKEELHQLYEADGKSLPFIMNHMKSQYGLDKSKPQYERVFKKWKFKKRNISKKEWGFIVSRLYQREAAGQRTSLVKLNGVQIPDMKIKKQRRIYGMSTLERQRLLLKIAPRPMTPPNIEICTPPGSPAPRTMDFELFASSELHGALGPRLSMDLQEEMQFSSADKTPWRQFLRAFSNINISSSITAPNEVAIYTQDSTVASSNFADKVEDLIWTNQYLNHGEYEYIHTAVYHPTPYLPPRKDGFPDINLNGRHELSPLGKQLELLKHVVYLLSNNYSVKEIAPLVVEYARDVKYGEFLARLISSSLFTGQAFAEKLLLPAAIAKNFPLVEILLNSGVAINYRHYGDLAPNFPINMTLLQCAIAICDEDQVRCLLRLGANPRMRVRFSLDDGGITMLNFAIQKANITVFECLVQHLGDGSGGPRTDYEECDFLTAACSGKVPIFDLLVSKQPQIFADLKKRPWLLYEAAAFGGNVCMLKALQARGLDNRARSHLNQGSPLVYALFAGNAEAADYLLETGFNVDTYGTHIYEHKYWMGTPPYYPRLQWRRHMDTHAPIHSAVFTGNIDMLRRLIARGTDPNQPGRRFPLQIAAGRGDLEMAQLLLEAGAGVNHVGLFPMGVLTYDAYSIEDCSMSADRRYVSATPEQSAVQIALDKGDSKMFELLIHYGARLPIIISCACTRGQDNSLDRHSLPLGGFIGSDIPCTCSNEYDITKYSKRMLIINESVWNPVLNAARGKNRELFDQILNIATAENLPWMTAHCIAECAEAFGARFVSELLVGITFRLPSDSYRELLVMAVKENEEIRAQEILESHELSAQDTAAAFAEVAYHGRSNLFQTFLERGCWPDEWLDRSRISEDFNDIFSDCTPFGCDFSRPSVLEIVIHSKHDLIKQIISDHYHGFTNRVGEPKIKRHFMQAYSIAIRCGDIDLAQMLVHGVDISTVLFRKLPWRSQEECQVSAICLAFSVHQYHCVHWLLDNGAEIEVATECAVRLLMLSPLQHASQGGELSLVKRLLNKGADINAQPNTFRGATALQYAAMGGHFETVNLLLDAGADINAPPGHVEGRSAIEGAAEWGRIDMVSYLLEQGAGESLKGFKNTNYRRTVFRAWQHGHHALARMLLQWKAENDLEHSDEKERIEKILETMPLETLICAESIILDPEMLKEVVLCAVCVPSSWARDWERDYHARKARGDNSCINKGKSVCYRNS